jgi:hypothetical protein
MGGAYRTHAKDKHTQDFRRDTQSKRPLGRCKHRLENDIKIHLQEIG